MGVASLLFANHFVHNIFSTNNLTVFVRPPQNAPSYFCRHHMAEGEEEVDGPLLTDFGFDWHRIPPPFFLSSVYDPVC